MCTLGIRANINYGPLTPSKVVETLALVGLAAPSDNQIRATLEINQHYLTNETVKSNIDSKNTTIFGFEGAGSYRDPWTYGKGEIPYHSIGRYGAMMVVMKGDKITYITVNASTLPDDGINSVVNSGVYDYKSGQHKRSESNEKFIYPALNPVLEALPRYKQGMEGYVEGVNIHAAGDGRGNNWSTACQIIHAQDYVAFGKAVGYIKAEAKDQDNVGNIQKNLYATGEKSDLISNVHVRYVLDRKLMPSNQKKLFKLPV